MSRAAIDWAFVHWIRDAICEYTSRHPDEMNECNVLVKEMFSDTCSACDRIIISEKLKDKILNEKKGVASGRSSTILEFT